VLEWSYFFRW